MYKIAYVKLRPFGKVYRYLCDTEDIAEGDKVVVEGDFGLSVGDVLRIKEDSIPVAKSIVRKATVEDIEVFNKNLFLEEEAFDFCLERIKKRQLPMKLLVVEATLDRKRIIFYFTAEGRIDFRDLVKDLAAKYKTRIEMRQIGVRDQAKFLGGIGVCGMEVCCKEIISFFQPISLRMAKEQEVVMNVSKLSGICGRLKCCLRYEYYAEIEEVIQDEEIQEEEKEPEIKKISFLNKVLTDLEEEKKEEESD
ncbi:MAG: regulatory iron-sulfur-containing complex subunit RicT [Thermodesulfovibrionaceae bacterium]